MASILQRPSEGCQAQVSMAYLETQLTKDLRQGKARRLEHGDLGQKCVEKCWTFTSKSWKVLCIYIYMYTYMYIYTCI